MVTRFVAVQRQYPAKASVHPIAEGEELEVDGVGRVGMTRDDLGFYYLYYFLEKWPGVKLRLDPYQLRWVCPFEEYPCIGLFDSEEEAWRVLLDRVHGLFAAQLGVENTWEAVGAELKRLQWEAYEDELLGAGDE